MAGKVGVGTGLDGDCRHLQEQPLDSGHSIAEGNFYIDVFRKWATLDGDFLGARAMEKAWLKCSTPAHSEDCWARSSTTNWISASLFL